mmetsp:Transcript_34459/g.109455  ORF Transcript_34459/g.109455 Transcript_34459/m.109455 type:complete len:244 (-) Transcript_34459:186-917(-)
MRTVRCCAWQCREKNRPMHLHAADIVTPPLAARTGAPRSHTAAAEPMDSRQAPPWTIHSTAASTLLVRFDASTASRSLKPSANSCSASACASCCGRNGGGAASWPPDCGMCMAAAVAAAVAVACWPVSVAVDSKSCSWPTLPTGSKPMSRSAPPNQPRCPASWPSAPADMASGSGAWPGPANTAPFRAATSSRVPGGASSSLVCGGRRSPGPAAAEPAAVASGRAAGTAGAATGPPAGKPCAA